MKRSRILKVICALFALALVCPSQPLLACAACYGKSDSPLAVGMNWGIASLLVCVVLVLSAFGSFFIYLAKKAATVPLITSPKDLPNSTQKA